MAKKLFFLCVVVLILCQCFSLTIGQACVFDDECDQKDCCKSEGQELSDTGKCKGYCDNDQVHYMRPGCYFNDYCRSEVDKDYFCCFGEEVKGSCYKTCPDGTTSIEGVPCSSDRECKLLEGENCCCKILDLETVGICVAVTEQLPFCLCVGFKGKINNATLVD